MSQGRELDRSLLAEIRSRLERLSETQHQLARDHRILTDAATRLRLGKSAEAVVAEIRESRVRSCCGITAIYSSPWGSSPWGRRHFDRLVASRPRREGGRRGNEGEGGRGDGGLGGLRDCGVHGAAVHDPRRCIAGGPVVRRHG
jgi:hypothetical protein